MDAILGLGSNRGDRAAYLRRALEELKAHPAIRVERSASVRETAPVGPPQRAFFNSAVLISTTLEPAALLREIKAIERRCGRAPSTPWGPRELDIDLLIYGDFRSDVPGLRVPHPEMHRRRFVLEPVAEIAGERVHPALQRSFSDLLAAYAGDEPPGKVVLAAGAWEGSSAACLLR